MVSKKALLEAEVYYGKTLMWNLKKNDVDEDNIQTKLNEIFMAGQTVLDRMWKQVTSELEKDTETEQLYIKVKHAGVWLVRTSVANVKLKDIPYEQERMSTSIMRSLDQLMRGEPWDEGVEGVIDEDEVFDKDL